MRILNPEEISFQTMDGEYHEIQRWDLIVAHPPCTYLTVTGNRWFNVDRYGEKAIQRMKDREEAVKFFMAFVNADCDRIAIENPIGYMSTKWRKPDQIIQPYQFGHPTTKSTCLWLKGLPKLQPTNIVDVDRNDVYEYVAKNGRIKHDSRLRSKCKVSERSKHRSKTFTGIAEAMADQWGGAQNRTTGKWVYDTWNDAYVCSACGYSYEIDSEDDIKKVCPLCGMDMEIS